MFSDTDNVYPTGSVVRVDVEAPSGGADINSGTVRITSLSQGYDSGAQDLTLGSIFYHWDTTGLNPADDYAVEVSLTDTLGRSATDDSLVITLMPNPPAIIKLVSEIDISFPAVGISVSVIRTYLLGSSLTTVFGRQWTHNYLMQVHELPDGLVRLRNADGSASFFKPGGGEAYDSPRGDFRTLTKESDGSYELREKSGTLYTFDASGTLIRIAERNGNTLILHYDSEARLQTIMDASGQTTEFAYDANGRITSITDPAGRSVSYEYDADGNLIAFTDIGGFRTTYAYDASHTLTMITDPAGRQTFFTTDDEDRLASVSNVGDNNKVTFFYESPVANQMMVTDALGNDTVLTYDVHGSVKAIEDAGGSVTSIAYDDNANPIELVDANGNRTMLTYDDRGNVLSITDAKGNTRTFGYDNALDKITSLTDAKNRTTAFEYDTRGNLIAITYPNGASETFGYDDDGNLIRKTDRKNQTIVYDYDGNGRLIAKRFSDGTSDMFSYDTRGNLTSATDENGTIAFAYDDADRLVQVTYPGGETVSYAYDAAGNRTQLVYPDGTTLDYAYDESGRLVRIENGGVVVAAYEHDTLGRRTRRELQNGTVTTYAYDAIGNLEELINQKSNSEVISRFAYTYDNLGNRTTMTTLEGTTQYVYDAISQLIRVTMPTGVMTSYDLDEESNRVSVSEDGNTTSYSTNELNQYTDVGGDGYSYDDNGNLIEKSAPSGVTTYDYDFENRLVRVSTPSDTISYAYDPFGRRISKTTSNGTTHYIYDALDVLIEKDESGAVDARYIHGTLIDEVLVMRRNGEDYYYSHDGLVSVVNITDSAAGIVDSFSYDAYGTPSAVSAVGNPYLFTGREYEFETGLYYYRERYYDPSIGRFTSVDPIEFVGGANLYSYVANNPTRYTDPLGLWLWDLDLVVVSFWWGFNPETGEKGFGIGAGAGAGIYFSREAYPVAGGTIAATGAVWFGGSYGTTICPNGRCSWPLEPSPYKVRGLGLGLTLGGTFTWGRKSGDPTFLQCFQNITKKYANAQMTTSSTDLYSNIAVPYESCIIRANVPIFGQAHGANFKEYRVEYGEGPNPANWTTIATSTTPQTRDVTPADLDDSLDITIHGNLTTWDTGLTNYVYLPSHPKDHPINLSGTYTVRLVVTGKDGSEVEDRVTVTVANVIPNAWGGLVRSKDDKAVLTVSEQAIMDAFRLISIQPTDDAPDVSYIGRRVIGKVFEVREAGERFTKEAELRLSFSQGELGVTDPNRLGIYGYNADTKTWEHLPSTRREGEKAVFTKLRELHPYYALMASEMLAEGSSLEPAPDTKTEMRNVRAVYASGPYLVRNTFEDGLGEWSNRDNEVGAEVALDNTATYDGTLALKITNTNAGGNFAVNMVSTPFDARDYPIVQFDYRIPQGVKTNLLVKVSGHWYEVGFTDDPKELAGKRVNIAHIGDIQGVRTDDQWHTAWFNLYDMLRTKTGNTLVEQMIMADWDVGGFMKLQFSHNEKGATYYIDNFSISREVRAGLRLDDESILVDHFNQKKESNALGSVTELFTDGHTGRAEIGFNDDSAAGSGYALRLSYDVAEASSYAGYVSPLNNLDLREYQTLTLFVKGEANNQDLWTGLKDAAGHESKVSLRRYLQGHFPTAWRKVEIPLAAFTGVTDWGRIENLSLSFQNSDRNRGMVLVDDLEFHKQLTHLSVDNFERTDERNVLGRKHFTVVSGAVAINGKRVSDAPNGIYRLSYGGNIGEIKAYASDVFSFAQWQTELGGVDCSNCGTVSFRIRGAEGGERPNLYLNDGSFRWGVNIEDYAEVTTDWQEVTISLSVFAEYGVDLTHLAELQFVFEWEKMSGTIYLDDIQFGAPAQGRQPTNILTWYSE